MELGSFSISLTVKDIEVSKAFYEKLGFKAFHGDVSQNWLVMKNGDHVIGLFGFGQRDRHRQVREEHFNLQSRLGPERTNA